MPSGAADFVASPELEAHQVAAMIGVHLQPGLPAGTVSAPSGVMNASADNFDLVVHGRPAHGAYPHLAQDPILAAAATVQALQQIVSRRIDPMSSAVVSVGRIVGGHSHNAIPGEVLLQGTLRAYTEREREALRGSVREIAEGIAQAHRCSTEVRFDLGEPVLDNDERLSAAFSQGLSAGAFEASSPIRSCGADDFAFFAARIPSLMIFAGVGDGDPRSPGLHHPAFAPDDSAVENVARLMLIAYFAAARALAVSSTTETDSGAQWPSPVAPTGRIRRPQW
jgi:amidohydrolase